MSRIVWVIALMGIGAWTLLAGSVYGLIQVIYYFVTGGAPVPADIFTTGDRSALAAALPWLAALKAVGSGVVIAIWATVSAVILFGAFILSRIFAMRVQVVRQPQGGPAGFGDANAQVIEGVVVPTPADGARSAHDQRPPPQS